MEVCPNVHRFEAKLQDRLLIQHFILAERQIVCLDAGFVNTPSETILPYVQSLGMDESFFRAVMVTHCDIDHYGGCESLLRFNPEIKVYAHSRDVPYIENSLLNWEERVAAPLIQMGLPPDPIRKNSFFELAGQGVKVDQSVSESHPLPELAPLGDRMRILHLPGHTAGHIGIYDSRYEAAIIGDAVLGEGIPSRTRELLFVPGFGDLRDYLNTIAKLRDLPVQQLCCAHFPLLTGHEVRRFLDRSERFVYESIDIAERYIRNQGRPKTTKQLCGELYDHMGKWPDKWRFKAHEFFVPLMEYMNEQGMVQKTTGESATESGFWYI